ncbi:deoxyguanosinetriphosphate triphosphohydrolase [Asticcacaulis sp. SL142]|uniref:deoxyguanosinetriphosphate triphosphohydrolase n=1 Tax=Asticcacaulis sp. SL142 TaxID=2995155 RepID=UPI00226CD2B8|nr:deoxyguanosinetriphosphate triphosphohydrolase [Asticcacaulis sp. SL142]WAC49081.1 deoxyguanosinetriphosphate triphosphohydrolase [Asticcacaulis sp. SL142]
MPPYTPLSPYAENSAKSLGRLYTEDESSTRTPFARDRDRIIHCTAFRRLKGKTQVFVANEGDYFRTRLTHSLEVAQIARSLALSLNVEQDLAETVALAHDLGHPPFGHAGEDELHKCMEPWGGFDHNVQTFRVVTKLEHRYPAFEGLNLTWETLEGIIKHNGPSVHLLSRPSWKAVKDFNDIYDLRMDTYASIEAQIAAIADDIAYNNHDVDDGLKAGLFTIDDLRDIPLIGPALASTEKDWPDIDDRMLRLEGVRRMIGAMIRDVTEETQRRLEADGIETAEDVRKATRQMVAFSGTIMEGLARLRAFLYARMYKHHHLNRTRSHAKRILNQMFYLYMEEQDVLPDEWYQLVCSKDTEAGRARVICDYIAGMTDSFAIEEHRKLFSFT